MLLVNKFGNREFDSERDIQIVQHSSSPHELFSMETFIYGIKTFIFCDQRFAKKKSHPSLAGRTTAIKLELLAIGRPSPDQ